MKKNYNEMSLKELLIENLLRQDDLINVLTDIRKKVTGNFDYIDTAELVNLLHITRKTAETWCKNGVLRVAKIGGKLYYKLSDVASMFLLPSHHILTPTIQAPRLPWFYWVIPFGAAGNGVVSDVVMITIPGA